jgi:hypothetical protein
VLQKSAGVRRLIGMLSIPILTMILAQAPRPAALACSLLSLAVYLPLTAWLSLWIGLKVKSRGKAIVSALAGVVGWCLLPLVFVFMPLMKLRPPGILDSPLNFSIFLSPAMIVAVNEYGDWREFGGNPWFAMGLNFFVSGSLLYIIRRHCLAHADRFLGRAESSDKRVLTGPAGAQTPPVVEYAVD